MSDDAVVKKVAPYPIPAQILKAEGQPTYSLNIVKLTNIGFLGRADTNHFYQVGENYKVFFMIPLSDIAIHSTVKVIKTYDAIETMTATEKTKMYTVEMHFVQIEEMYRRDIQHFLIKIGQIK